MSTLKVNAIKNTSDVEMYLCKAWVNFNGTGTVAIRGSGNVTSITDNGTGNYTVNFTTAMPDANYNVVACGSKASDNAATGRDILSIRGSTYFSSSSIVVMGNSAGDNSNVDLPYVCVSIFR